MRLLPNCLISSGAFLFQIPDDSRLQLKIHSCLYGHMSYAYVVYVDEWYVTI